MKRLVLLTRVIVEGVLGLLLIPDIIIGLTLDHRHKALLLLDRSLILLLGILLLIDAIRIRDGLKPALG